MILKGAQRGHAKQLAVHLLNAEDNDHVEVHSMRGFLSTDVTGAFKEVQAIARGTKCTQPFFSVSLNPPAGESASVEDFKVAVQKIEEKHDLTGQPRVLIFHEKDGRRHAHVVWSRIVAETMTAKELSFFKNKLRDVSRELFLEHQWLMPRGLMDSAAKNPTNVTLAEWQEAKRLGRNAIDQRKLIQECWAASDGKGAFQAALKERGYALARGNRRSHVIVSHDGQVFAVARAIGIKTKLVRERLGEADQYPGVEEALEAQRLAIKAQFFRMAGQARTGLRQRRTKLDHERKTMIAAHRKERVLLEKGQQQRWEHESRQRQKRFRAGLGGLWQRLSGTYRRIRDENQHEAYEALKRDRAQKQQTIAAQLAERRGLEHRRTELRQQAFGLIEELKSDRDRLIEQFANPSRPRARRRKVQQQSPEVDFGPDMTP